MKRYTYITACVVIFGAVCGCTTIPEEAASLNEEISNEISSMHKINKFLVNAYFESKRIHIRELEEKSIERFIDRISSEMLSSGALGVGPKELKSISREIDNLHRVADSHEDTLNDKERKIIEGLQTRFSATVKANNAITGLLTSYKPSNYNGEFSVLGSLTLGKGTENINQLISDILGETSFLPMNTADQ